MKFGLLIIGDEILSGRRSDKHFAKTVELLKARGLRLSWASYVGDDRELLVATLKRTFAGDDVVFSCGGIGVTPDDHTRQAAAAALGVELVLHPDAEREIRARFGGEVTPQRLQLGAFPAGARTIPNPFNRMCGFSVGRHYFMPGFPEMAWPMMEWVLDNHYRELHHATLYREESVFVYGSYESQLLDLMQAVEAACPGVTVFSLPSFGGNGIPRNIELGAKGDSALVAAAMAMIRGELAQRRLDFSDELRRQGNP